MRLLVGIFALLVAMTGRAEEPLKSLDELLQHAREARSTAQHVNAEREARFLREKEHQQALLAEAKRELAALEHTSASLQQRFAANEDRIAALEARLNERAASLGELFGGVRQVAHDTAGLLTASLVSAQYPDRIAMVHDLAERKALPSADELERLWLTLLQEMTESGKVVRFDTRVITADGQTQDASVTRVGVFNAFSDGQYLRYLPESRRLVLLARQPAPRFQKLAMTLAQGEGATQPVGLDPTRGAILSVLTQKPSMFERIDQAGAIAYIILAVGILAVLLALERFIYLTRVDRAVQTQLRQEGADQGNPLGRILQVFHENARQGVEALQLKLDEAILKEIPRVERGLATIAILAAVAPLLGLLGTVTGMIETFQSITIFGTGDPKHMSGGISQALVTTELGLMVAIPVILLHSFLTGKGNRITQVLDEQGAGIVATQAERVGGGVV